jgi:photosystem II stability/assembly factor-like uncharacterized protein
MTIALSHGGPTVYCSDAASEELLVGTAKGVATLRRNGAGWRVAGKTLGTQHISAILIEPTTGDIFAGAYGDGSLRVSRDGGLTWALCDMGLTEKDVFSIESIPGPHGNRLYVGTEPAKLFVSDDMGGHWAELSNLRSVETVDSWSFPGPPHIAHAKHISFDPINPSTMYVSIEVGGLLRSDDAGQTWRDEPGMYEDVHRLVINPADPQRRFVTGGNGIYASLNGGSTWEHWTTRDHEIGGYPDQLVFHPEDPDLMFVASAKDGPGTWRTSHHAGARISRSEDGGRTWKVLSHGLPDRMQGNIEAMCLEAYPGGCSVFAANTAGEIFASDDAGDSWDLVVEGLAPISKGGHYIPLQEPVGA